MCVMCCYIVHITFSAVLMLSQAFPGFHYPGSTLHYYDFSGKINNPNMQRSHEQVRDRHVILMKEEPHLLFCLFHLPPSRILPESCETVYSVSQIPASHIFFLSPLIYLHFSTVLTFDVLKFSWIMFLSTFGRILAQIVFSNMWS